MSKSQDPQSAGASAVQEETVDQIEVVSEVAVPSAAVIPPAGSHLKLIFGIVALALLMGSIDQNIVATALKPIGTSLHSSVNWTAWTITAYGFGVVFIVPIAGRIADQYGRKRIFLLAVIIFTASSVACGLATSIYILIPLRAIQALGGGAFLPPATGIIAENFGANRDRAIALFSSIFPLGAFFGPIFGGIITQDWSWRGVFLINLPLGIVLLLAGKKYIPHSAPKPAVQPDFKGTFYLAFLLIPAMYGITSLGSSSGGIIGPEFIIPEIVAIFAFFVLRHHLKTVDDPIIPLDLLKQRNFATMNFVGFLNGGVMIGFGTLVPLYALERYHFHILEAGTVLTGRAIGSVVVASMTAFLLRRIGYRIPMVAGFTVSSLGLLCLASSPKFGFSVYMWLAFGALIMGIGGGMSAPATNNAILNLAPDKAPSVMGLRSMFRQIGGIVALSVMTAYVARSSNQGLALSHAFFVFAIAFVVIMIPLVVTVPAHKGTW